ncbi:hypothetical protein C8R45DRAFT_428447 [Mycena sanguinolenta]|nr:hypothetical protein C8R45DRAFT_428447 [Mycena sanguinolenta]
MAKPHLHPQASVEVIPLNRHSVLRCCSHCCAAVLSMGPRAWPEQAHGRDSQTPPDVLGAPINTPAQSSLLHRFHPESDVVCGTPSLHMRWAWEILMQRVLGFDSPRLNRRIVPCFCSQVIISQDLNPHTDLRYLDESRLRRKCACVNLVLLSKYSQDSWISTGIRRRAAHPRCIFQPPVVSVEGPGFDSPRLSIVGTLFFFFFCFTISRVK